MSACSNYSPSIEKLKQAHTHTTTWHTPQSPFFLSHCLSVSIVSLCISFHSVHLNLHSRVLHHRAIYSDTLSTEKTNILHRVAGQEGNSRWVNNQGVTTPHRPNAPQPPAPPLLAHCWLWTSTEVPLYCFDSRRALLPADHALDGVRAHIWHQLEIDWWRLQALQSDPGKCVAHSSSHARYHAPHTDESDDRMAGRWADDDQCNQCNGVQLFGAQWFGQWRRQWEWQRQRLWWVR